MKNKISIVLISLFVLAVSSCNYSCPGFDTELLKWMPYELDDELIYTNQYDDTLIFRIYQKEISESYETSHKNRNYCESHLYYDIAEISNQSINMIFRINKLENNTSIGIEINIQNNSGFFYIETENLNTKIITLESNSYETITFENDTIGDDNEIWKVILAKNYGIIQFYDREADFVWTQQHE
jgi:predicted DNA binding protein